MRGLDTRSLGELLIEDARAFRDVAIHADLCDVARRGALRFRVLPPTSAGRADRALLLNLTYWTPGGGDVLPRARIPADVVAHAAWHHLAAVALAPPSGKKPTADSLFLGEAIASAFDAYMVGRLLASGRSSSFLESQVPAMAETTAAAGLSARGFEKLLGFMAGDPERAFEELRSLLYRATRALHESRDVDAAATALAAFDGERFAPLLHRYELSNWILFARAYARDVTDRAAASVDRELTRAASPLGWLADRWITPALSEAPARSQDRPGRGRTPARAPRADRGRAEATPTRGRSSARTAAARR